MNEKNDFALVPMPPAAIEKVESGAMRGLSSMVADALMLAKHPVSRIRRIVLLDDVHTVRDVYREILNQRFSQLEILEFADGDTAWSELSRAAPNLFITDVSHTGMKCQDMLSALTERKTKFPILVISATLDKANADAQTNSWRAKAPNLNVTFIPKPFQADGFVGMVGNALHLRVRAGLNLSARRNAGPPRIVHVDDEEFILEMVSGLVREKFKDVIVDTFQNGDKAWGDLSRADPDLLITDLLNNNIPGRTPQVARSEFGMSGYELLPLLAKKKISYPVLVLSGSLSRNGYEAEVRRLAGPNLNISFLPKPFASGQLLTEVFRLLQPSVSP